MTQRRNENISAGAWHVYGWGFQVSAYQLIMSRQMSVSRHKTALAQDAGELEIPLSRTKSQDVLDLHGRRSHLEKRNDF